MAEEERRHDHGYSFGKSRLDRLREELNEFAGPQYETLYRRWREQGDCVLGENPHSPGKGSGGFASYRLDHDYECSAS